MTRTVANRIFRIFPGIGQLYIKMNLLIWMILLTLLPNMAKTFSLKANKQKCHSHGSLEGAPAPLWATEKDSANIIKSSENETNKLHVIFPGGGIFFYWQAGVVSYLREQGYDLSMCTFTGASAGALTATLTSTNVDFYKATDLALSLAADAGVWDRSGGLQGVWGPMIEEWLDTLLPQSIEEYTKDERLSLLVTPVPSFGKSTISTFTDRTDLIKCNMASVHLGLLQPWFLDGKLTSDFRQKPHIDGSFLSNENHYHPLEGVSERKILTLDYKDDPLMQSRGGFDIVEALSPDGIYGLLDQGKSFGKYMEEKGQFQYISKTALA